MRKLLSLFAFVYLLSGCSSELSFEEVNKKGVNKNIQSFIDDVKDENGVHLYFEKQNVVYVYLNGTNVKQGDKAILFTDFNVEDNDETLNIFYNIEETEDYSSQSLENELLYKVNSNKKDETIKLFKNGKEDSFGKISGSGK